MRRKKETLPSRQARGSAVQKEQVNLTTLGNAISIGILGGALVTCLPGIIIWPLVSMGVI